MSQSFFELSFIHLASLQSLHTISVAEVVQPLSLVDRAIGLSHHAFALTHPLMNLAFVLASI